LEPDFNVHAVPSEVVALTPRPAGENRDSHGNTLEPKAFKALLSDWLVPLVEGDLVLNGLLMDPLW
jgi:hypothetical protein